MKVKMNDFFLTNKNNIPYTTTNRLSLYLHVDVEVINDYILNVLKVNMKRFYYGKRHFKGDYYIDVNTIIMLFSNDDAIPDPMRTNLKNLFNSEYPEYKF